MTAKVETPTTETPYPWYVPLAVAGSGFVLLYYTVIYKLALDWLNDDNYSHGFLIPIISGFLIWCDRKRISRITIEPATSGVFLILMSLAGFLIANIGAELFTMRFSMILVVLSATVFLAGYPFAKALFWPCMYLVFMIPLPAIIWNQIAFPLKLFATRVAVETIQLLNIPVFREGNIIHLANTTLEVVDACSGIRSLTSLLALSAAFAFISDHSRTQKIILFLSAVPIAIIVNIFRLTVTAILARSYGEKVAQGFLHDMSGILVFVLAFCLFYLVHIALTRLSGRNPEPAGSKDESG